MTDLIKTYSLLTLPVRLHLSYITSVCCRIFQYDEVTCITMQLTRVLRSQGHKITHANNYLKKNNFWATVCKPVCPLLSDRCLSCLSVCNVGVLWLNSWTDQDETWHGGRPPPHCVRWGPRCPSPKAAQPPIYGPLLLWPNGWMD